MDSPTNTPSAFYVMLGLILFIVVIIMAIFFDWSWKKLHSTEQLVSNILMLLSFALLVVGLCVLFLPSLKEFKNMLAQISNVSYVLLFTVGALLLYTNLPSQTLNNYAYLINPLVLVAGAIAFYWGLRENDVDQSLRSGAIQYQRIKMFLVFLCFVTLMGMVYVLNPGHLADHYFGNTGMLLSVLLGVFALLYVIVLTTSAEQPSAPNLISNFSMFGVWGSIGFVGFLVLMTSLLATDQTFAKNQTKGTAVLLLMLVASLLWVVLLGAHTMGGSSVSGSGSQMLALKNGLNVLIGLVLSGLLIYTITYYIGHSVNLTSLALNMLLVALVLGLVYKTVFVKLPVGNAKKNALVQLVASVAFYIPCLLNQTFDGAGNWMAGQQSDAGSWMMLLVACVLLVGYYRAPKWLNWVSSQGGKQLVLQPVYLNRETTLGNYLELRGEKNPSKKYDYQYAISCWVYLDAMPPNTSPQYNDYTSLLSFGGKPQIAYHARKNTLKVTMADKNSGEKVLYTQTKVLLQKWNHFIVNYNGGTMDIFLNGQLVKSVSGVVPYYTYDSLSVGENNGIEGGICNVVYFRHALNASNVYYLYNSVAGRSPPLLDDSREQVILPSLQG